MVANNNSNIHIIIYFWLVEKNFLLYRPNISYYKCLATNKKNDCFSVSFFFETVKIICCDIYKWIKQTVQDYFFIKSKKIA